MIECDISRRASARPGESPRQVMALLAHHRPRGSEVREQESSVRQLTNERQYSTHDSVTVPGVLSTTKETAHL